MKNNDLSSYIGILYYIAKENIYNENIQALKTIYNMIDLTPIIILKDNDIPSKDLINLQETLKDEIKRLETLQNN